VGAVTKVCAFVRFLVRHKKREAQGGAPDEFFYIQIQFIIIFKFNMTLKHLGFLI
jgi:hypothetical protein